MFYNFASLAVRLILALLTRCSVEGLEHIPSSGAFMLVSNHLNLVDPPVLGGLLPGESCLWRRKNCSTSRS